MASIGFFVHTFVVYPIASYLLHYKPQVYNRTRRIVFALIFLSAVALIELGMNLQIDSEVNYFSVLGVPRSATTVDIKKAYRKLSLDVHPDRNPGQQATPNNNFILIQQAHETLINDERRDAYDKWGLGGIKWFEKSESYVLNGLLELVVRSIGWSAWTLFMTLNNGGAETNARFLSFCGLCFVVSYCLSLQFANSALVEENNRWKHGLTVSYLLGVIIPHTTIYEQCEILWRMYPNFVLMVNLVQGEMYEDVAKINSTQLQGLVHGMELFHKKLDVLNERYLLAMNSGVAVFRKGKTTGLLPSEAAMGKFVKKSNKEMMEENGEEKEEEESRIEENHSAPKLQESKRFLPNIPNIVYVIVIYGLINYFSK